MIADACQRHKVALLVVEIHAPLVMHDARFVPFLSLDHELTRADSTFMFTSASKGWNIPGLKCGLAVAGSAAGGKLLLQRWEALLAGPLRILPSVSAFTERLTRAGTCPGPHRPERAGLNPP